MSHYLEKRQSEQTPPAAFILQPAEWTLNNNVFHFQNQFYKQKKGTVMGLYFAPNYSNLFMGFWEETFVYSSLNIYLEKDYMVGEVHTVDDILLIWLGSETELLQFHSCLNNTISDLKLSLEFSLTEIHFLDLTIFKDRNGDFTIPFHI